MAKLTEPIEDALDIARQGFKKARRATRRAGGSDADEGPKNNVWQWHGRKYRIRATLLLLVNVVLFAGLCCFSFWLRTGQYIPFFNDQYWQIWQLTFDWTHEQQITLIDFLTYPISIEQVPMMMVITGLVLATLTAIPILIAMLYRFRFSLIFTCLICFLAVLPWLAICVTLCCYLSRWRPLQFSFRYATALLAMLPMLVYFALASRDTSISHLPPLELAMLYVPWVMALVAACLLMAIVLLIARLVNYRPGAIAPLLAVMFALPVVLFEARIGRDELYYRLLEHEYGPGSQVHFVNNVDLSQMIHHLAVQRLREIKDPQATLKSVMEQVRLTMQFEIARRNHESFAAEKDEARRACQWFINRFSNSRYVPNAMYIQGRTIDLRIDHEFFRETLILRYYQDFPDAASRPVWQTLFERYPESPLASVAGLRLATLETREGHVDWAVVLLDQVIGRWDGDEQEDQQVAGPGGFRGFFAKKPATSSLEVDPSVAAQKAAKMKELLVNNRDPEQNDLALRELFRMDPRHRYYQRNLEQLLAAIRRGDVISRLGDNLQVMIAAAEPSHSLKIEKLEQVVERLDKLEQTDAMPQALYELGAAYQNDFRFREARERYLVLVSRYPESTWAEEAHRRLSKLGMSRLGRPH